MINKDTYRQVQIAILSDIAEYKDGNKKEVLWKDCLGEDISIELLDKDNEMIVRWYCKDRIYFVAKYKDGLLNGERTQYYQNGNIRRKANYKNHKLDGKLENYHYDYSYEKLLYVEVETYKDGKRIQ